MKVGYRTRGLVALVALTMGASVLMAVPASAAPTWVVTPSNTPAFNGDAPDPHVLRVGSTYYAYTTGTTWGNRIGILKSTNPTSGWQVVGTALPSAPSWQQVDTQNAPGVIRMGGRYVMYYNAKPLAEPFRCISVATSSSPEGPFVDSRSGPLVCDTQRGGVIDASPFIDSDGQRYLYWKNNDGFTNHPAVSAVYVAPLSPDGLTIGPRFWVMSKSDDRPPLNTVDNPQMVRVGGVYYLFFTGGDYLKASYAVGYAVCNTPTGPCTRPEPGPILSSYGSVAGPGGGSVFSDPAGRYFMAYHAYAQPCPNFCSPPRRFFVAPMRQPFTWSPWARLSGTVVGDPAAGSRTANRLDVLARRSDGQIHRKQWSGSGWTGWNPLGGTPAGDPSVASWGPNRLDVFVRGTNNRLHRKWLNADGWSAWTQLAGTIAGDPAVTAWGSSRLDVFVRGTSNELLHRSWSGSTGWTGWENLGGAFQGTPAVVSRGAGLLDVFVRGTDNQLHTKWYNAGGWSAWTPLGGVLKGDPTAASWSVTRLDVFGRGTDNRLHQRAWSNGAWSGWTASGSGILAGDPAAVSWAPGRIDVFARAGNNQLLHKYFN
jgi:hypothetical protein